MPLFEQKENPFDFGPAAGPINSELVAEFQKAIADWKECRHILVNDCVPALDKAIGAVSSWATVVEKLLELANRFLPATGTTTPQSEQRVAMLTDVLTAATNIASTLRNIRNSVLGAARTLNTAVS